MCCSVPDTALNEYTATALNEYTTAVLNDFTKLFACFGYALLSCACLDEKMKAFVLRTRLLWFRIAKKHLLWTKQWQLCSDELFWIRFAKLIICFAWINDCFCSVLMCHPPTNMRAFAMKRETLRHANCFERQLLWTNTRQPLWTNAQQPFWTILPSYLTALDMHCWVAPAWTKRWKLLFWWSDCFGSVLLRSTCFGWNNDSFVRTNCFGSALPSWLFALHKTTTSLFEWHHGFASALMCCACFGFSDAILFGRLVKKRKLRLDDKTVLYLNRYVAPAFVDVTNKNKWFGRRDCFGSVSMSCACLDEMMTACLDDVTAWIRSWIESALDDRHLCVGSAALFGWRDCFRFVLMRCACLGATTTSLFEWHHGFVSELMCCACFGFTDAKLFGRLVPAWMKKLKLHYLLYMKRQLLWLCIDV